MKYRVDMDPETRVRISHFSPHLKRKLKEALRDLSKDPFLGKPLQEDLEGFKSYRLNRFRLVYQINASKHLLQVVTIGPRKTIYEELSRQLSRKPG